MVSERRVWAVGSAGLLALMSCVPGELFLTTRGDGGADSKLAPREASGGGGTAGIDSASGNGGTTGSGGATGQGGTVGAGGSGGGMGGMGGFGDSGGGCKGVDAAEPALDLTPACETCGGLMCCSKLQACAADPACEAIVRCSAKCIAGGGMPTPCAGKCLSESEAGSSETLADALFVCISEDCSGCYSSSPDE